MKRSVAVGAILGAALLAIVGLATVLRSETVHQPIDFNHRLHVEDLGSACQDCHLYALNGMRATIPNIETCSICHTEALTDSPEEATLVGHVQRSEPIPWRKVYQVPDHVFFSHRRHTLVAGIECETCHGAIGQQEEAVSRPLVRITMNRCMQCHDERLASNDCIQCHK